jgi:HTH-type transcriptional regulator / antitoxin MqsA
MLVARHGTLRKTMREGQVPIYPESCGECGGKVSVSRDFMSIEVRGETITVPDIEHGFCRSCGETYLDLPSIQRLQEEAVRRVKRAKGLLTSEEIRDLRRSLGLSQTGFERLLGTGPKTVVRWEKGTVFQSATADRLMRLPRAKPELAELLDQAPRALTRSDAKCHGTSPGSPAAL